MVHETAALDRPPLMQGLLKRVEHEAAVELRHRKIRGRLAQDLVGLAQFAHFTLQRSDALLLRRGRTGAPALIALSLANPAAQRFRRAADLGGNRADRGRLRGVLALVVEHHPDRAGADLRRIRGYRLGHGSILPGSGASGKPGTVQGAQKRWHARTCHSVQQLAARPTPGVHSPSLALRRSLTARAARACSASLRPVRRLERQAGWTPGTAAHRSVLRSGFLGGGTAAPRTSKTLTPGTWGRQIRAGSSARPVAAR